MNTRGERQVRIVTLIAPITTLNRSFTGALLDNSGATQSLTAQLVDANYGDFNLIDVVAAHALTIDAGPSGVFILSGTAGTPGQKLVNSGTPGETCEILCVGQGPTFRVRNLVGSHWSLQS